MAVKQNMTPAVAQLNVRSVAREGSLSLHVADQLETQITGGDISVGQKLPTENQLCQSFGVSRTVVREAIAHLKSLGLVETRRGVGTTVIRTAITDAMPAKWISPTTVEDILHVLELRLTLEPEAAALAALRHDDDDRALLLAKHEKFKRARVEQSQARSEDYEFHYAVIAAAKNPLFKTLYQQLSQSLIPRSKLLSIEVDASATGKYLARVEDEHTYVLDAILARDGDAARDMMYRHLNRSRTMYAQYKEV